MDPADAALEEGTSPIDGETYAEALPILDRLARDLAATADAR